MACYAVVIRIDAVTDFDNIIGVHFYKLDRVQRLNLVQGLAHKVQKNSEKKIISKSPVQLVAALGLVFTLLCWLTLMKLFFL